MGIIYGTKGNDRILRDYLSDGVVTDPPDLDGTDPGHFNDIIYGYGGNDQIVLGYQSDIVDGGTGNDLIDARPGGRPGFYLVLSGGPGNDLILGSDGIDDLDGNYRDTVTDPAAGNDILIGGKGDDRYHVDSIWDVVVEREGEGDDTVFADLQYYRLRSNFENLSLLPDNAVGLGNEASNVMDAAAGGRLFGLGGDDFLFSYDGAILDGGDGNDFVQAFLGENVLTGGRGDDWLEIFETLDDSADIVPYRDLLRGGDGVDTLFAAAGADCLIGGRGNDVFGYYSVTDSTGTGTDLIKGGDGAPAFEAAGSADGDLILLPQYAGISEDYTPIPLDFDEYIFGGTGKGHISLADRGSDTLVCIDTDDEPGTDFLITIRDGTTRAEQYTMDDFLSPF